MTLSMLALILFCVATETAYEICFKHAADGTSLLQMLKKPLLWIGVFFWAVEMVAWIGVLEHVPLNIAFPLMSLVYVTTLAAGALILKENITLRHAAGALLITAGAAYIGVTAV